MKRHTVLLLTLWVSSLISQTRYESQLFSGTDVANYTYGQNLKYDGNNQVLTLDVYTGKGDIEKNRACIVFCFGGAFVSGTRNSPEIYYFANYLAQLGYICVSIDYRLDNINNLTTFNNEGKATIRAVQDAKAAIRYLKSKSNELGIDSNKIIIGGTSAGGITALTLGYSQYLEFTPYFRTLIDSMGGWEGNTNLLTNSSKVIGLFNFSGAIFDTAHIQNNDLPVYLDHAVYDATVPFYSGYPLGGQSQTKVYGSGEIYNTMIRKGGYAVLKFDSTTNHPRFSSGLNVFTDSYETYLKLKPFLYNVVKSSGSPSSLSTSEVEPIQFYPNPAQDILFIASNSSLFNVKIYALTGKKLLSYTGNEKAIDIRSLNSGIYFLKINNQTFKVIVE